MRVSYLKEFLKSYEEKYHLNACLIDENGVIEISSEHTGYSRVDWFQMFEQESIRSQVLEWKEDSAIWNYGRIRRWAARERAMWFQDIFRNCHGIW